LGERPNWADRAAADPPWPLCMMGTALSGQICTPCPVRPARPIRL